MVKPLITIVTVNYNTSDYIEVMFYALSKLTKNPYRIIVCDNGSDKKNILALVKIARRYRNAELIFRIQSEKANIGHAEALDMLIERVNSPYTVVLDSDCTFLLKNWDEVLIGNINDKVKIIGSPLPKGRSGIKPYDFPFCFATLFETETFKKLQVSCKPGNIDKGEDTCWEWRSKFLNNGFAAKIFVAQNTRDFKEGRFKQIICEEYYTEDGRLIASHLGRGSSGGTFKYYHKWFYNIPFFSFFIKKAVAAKQKRQWLVLCREIVDSQE